MRNTLRTCIACLAFFGLCSCFDIDTFISPIVFNPSPQESFQYESYADAELAQYVNPLFPDAGIENFGPVTFDSEGNTLYGYHLWHNAAPGRLILYCHGNYRNIDNYWPRAKLLYETGCDVLVFDYRGFGMSTGTITEAGMLKDAEAALTYATGTLGFAKNRILLYGYSLGSVPALHLAANAGMGSAIGIVLECPVGSTEIYVQDATYLSIPGSYLTGFELDNVGNIKKIAIPFLWIGGTADQGNRYDTHGRALFDGYRYATKYRKLVEGAVHADVPYVLDHTFAAYIDGLSPFTSGGVPFP
jgi:dienelactone hydrolase